MSAATAGCGTETGGFLRVESGSGTVFKPFPFSNAKVRTEAHWLHNQKCSMRCCTPSSQRRSKDFDGEKLSVSTRKSFPSLNLRKGFAQLGLAHLCSMADPCARVSPNKGFGNLGTTSWWATFVPMITRAATDVICRTAAWAAESSAGVLSYPHLTKRWQALCHERYHQ